MSEVVEKFVAMNKKQIGTLLEAAQIGFGAWEMLLRLNLEAGKSLLLEAREALAGGTLPRDATGLADWTKGQVQAGVEKVSGYTSNAYEIAGQAAGQFGELLERTLLDTAQDTADWVDAAVKSSPAPQAEAAAAAAMAQAQTLIEGISKAVRQTAGYADAGVRAAAAATADAVRKSAR
ncbi:MAG TPA: phasin family protein [Burkholderiales bacterium]|nr:phasin family protein [Burkholderiales bacterium]